MKATPETPSKRQAKKTPTATRTHRSVLGIKSILAPIDYSPASEKALGSAIGLARMCGATLTVLHVIEPVATPDFVKGLPLAMGNEKLAEECKQYLQQIVDRAGAEPEIIDRIVVRYGRAFNEIVSAARTLKADLIVIATHGRTGLKHVLLGSTTERVVQHAPCPVLVMRPRGRDFLA